MIKINDFYIYVFYNKNINFLIIKIIFYKYYIKNY